MFFIKHLSESVQVACTWLSLNCHVQVNWTPYFLEELLELRDTWILLTFSLGILLISLVLLLVFLRQRIFLAVALIQQGSKAVSQVATTVTLIMSLQGLVDFPIVQN